MITNINKAWDWKGFKASKILLTNDFGNVIFQTDKNDFWRLTPEDIACDKIADNDIELKNILENSDFRIDWEMKRLVSLAKDKLGQLKTGQKYCLKVPSILGGLYEENNLGKIDFKELIAFSGDIGFQIKDMKEGDKFEIKIKN